MERPASAGARVDDLLPSFSIIVPLVRHLGHALEAIESWSEQRYPRERFELIVMGDGSKRGLERRLRGRFGPADRLLHHLSRDERELFDAGARQAAGDVLVFSEAHCVAEPDFLAEMSRFLSSGDFAGACCHTLGKVTNAVGRIVSEDFENDFRTWTRPEDRRKVIIHGFALRRKIYLAVGGFEPPFGNFQDAALAARLEHAGHRLGYAERARVVHHYSRRLGDTVQQFQSYAVGECSYRLAHGEELSDREFGAVPEWREFRQATRADRRRILRTLGGELARKGIWRLDGTLLRATLRALRELPRVQALEASGSLQWARLRCRLSFFQPERGMRAFRAMCRHALRRERLRFLARRELALRSEPPEAMREGHWPIAGLAESSLVGFHECESQGGEWIRWSRPIAALRLAVPPGSYRVTLETQRHRELAGAGIRLFLDRHPVAASISSAEGRIAATLRPEWFGAHGEPLLILTCDPLLPWRRKSADPRPLGLPIRSITVAPSGDPAAAARRLPRHAPSARAEREPPSGASQRRGRRASRSRVHPEPADSARERNREPA